MQWLQHILNKCNVDLYDVRSKGSWLLEVWQYFAKFCIYSPRGIGQLFNPRVFKIGVYTGYWQDNFQGMPLLTTTLKMSSTVLYTVYIFYKWKNRVSQGYDFVSPLKDIIEANFIEVSQRFVGLIKKFRGKKTWRYDLFHYWVRC